MCTGLGDEKGLGFGDLGEGTTIGGGILKFSRPTEEVWLGNIDGGAETEIVSPIGFFEVFSFKLELEEAFDENPCPNKPNTEEEDTLFAKPDPKPGLELFEAAARNGLVFAYAENPTSCIS